MKKHFFLISIVFLMTLKAFTQTGADSLPIPWLHAEVLSNGRVILNFEAPCDSCDIVRYQIAVVDGFYPCKGEEPTDGTLNVIGGNQPIYLTDPWVGAFAIEVVYENCLSVWTFSNVIYYEVDYHNDYTLTVDIALEDGSDPEGSLVFAEGANCYYEPRSYQEQCGADSSAYFDAMEKGSYSLTIAKPGYQTEKIEDFYLSGDTTISVTLLAGPDPAPVDFYVDAQTALATWALPSGKTSGNDPGSFILVLNDSIVDSIPGNVYEYQFMGLQNNTDYTASVSAVYDWGESFTATYGWTTNFVGIGESRNDSKIDIFPNPAANQLNIQSNETVRQIRLISYTGRTVYEQQFNNKRVTLDVTGLKPGIYFARISLKNKIVNKKIVIR